MSGAEVFCIVGLGNPGPKYKNTRHNIGFEWIDALARQLDAREWSEKFEALWIKIQWQGSDLHLLKPQTFMNESGRSLQKWREKYQGAAKILVVFDDLDIPLGKIRYRPEGSDGGHRGIRNIIQRMGTQEIPRLRLGIGRPENETIDYVLSTFQPEEMKIVKRVTEEACLQFEIWARNSAEKAMTELNGRLYESGEQK